MAFLQVRLQNAVSLFNKTSVVDSLFFSTVLRISQKLFMFAIGRFKHTYSIRAILTYSPPCYLRESGNVFVP